MRWLKCAAIWRAVRRADRRTVPLRICAARVYRWSTALPWRCSAALDRSSSRRLPRRAARRSHRLITW